jgi:hypothetical protein
MSLKPCQATGEKLADDTTCGALCERFPACLPLPSVGLVADVHRLRMDAKHEADGAAATAESLSLIHQALIAGLARKESE